MSSVSKLSDPFRSADFRLLWSAVLVSNLGGLIQAVGAGWMMATISSSDAMVALVQAATTLPIMLFSLAAGAFADSYDRRSVMLSAQVLMMATSVALAALAYQELLTTWMLLGLTFLIGCGTAFHNPSWQASMGDIVPRTDLPSAVTLNSMAFNIMRSVGPAIGGLVVAGIGAAGAFAVNACSYVCLIAALLVWKRRRVPGTLPRESFGSAIAAGLRFVAMSPQLLSVVFRALVFGLSAVAILALLPLVARDLVGGGAATYGLLLASFGVGAIGGAFLKTRLREGFGSETITRLSFVGLACGAVLVAASRDVWLTCLGLLPAGASWVLALSLFNVTVQLSTPRWVVGRALSIYQTATFGGMAVGSWIWGSAGEAFGLQVALAAAAGVLMLGAVVGLRVPMPDLVALDLDPLNQFKEPSLRLDLRSRSGPIMVMVDYEIDQADVAAFLIVMAERRRVRIRDGARQWSLLRDLENPRMWTEAYHVPTWVEYVRHNMRRTKADADIYERLLLLHRGKTRPRVHRMIERQAGPFVDHMPIVPDTEVA